MARTKIQVICLGSNGGPVDSDLSSFLVRQAPDVKVGCPAGEYTSHPIVSVDSGSMLSSIAACLHRAALNITPNVHTTPRPASASPKPSKRNTRTRYPFADLISASSSLGKLACEEAKAAAGSDNTDTARRRCRRRRWELKRESLRLAQDVMLRYICSFMITHPHLDHMCGLVINSPVFAMRSRPKRASVCGLASEASIPGMPCKPDPTRGLLVPNDKHKLPVIAGSETTIKAMMLHMFNDVIWPDLINPQVGLIQTKVIPDAQAELVAQLDCSALDKGMTAPAGEIKVPYASLAPGVSVASFEVSHGLPEERGKDDIGGHSTAYFLRIGDHSANPSQTSAYSTTSEHKEVLILGDVEPDSISHLPRNLPVWRYAAQLIAAGRLSAIFIECSFSDSCPDEYLFGHLRPFHLVAEMVKLSKLVQAEKQRTKVSSAVRSDDGASSIARSDSGGSSRKRLPSPGSSPDSKRARVEPVEPEAGPPPFPSVPRVRSPSGESSSGYTVGGSDSDPDRDPLYGLTVYVMHIKRDGNEDLRDRVFDRAAEDDADDDDGIDSDEDDDDYDPLAQLVVRQLSKHAVKNRLGCQFEAAKTGWGYYV